MKKEITDELFRDKYETYSKLLFRIAFLHLGNTQDAEDILNLSSVYYQPEKAVDTLLADPDTDKSELPVDEVTITVTFQDGKKARKTVNVSFDKDGVAQFVMK